MKKIIIISLIMILSVGLITGCGKKDKNQDNIQKENQTNQNNEQNKNKNIIENTSVVGSQKIEPYNFEVISLKYENNVSTLEYAITNEGTSEITIAKYRVSIENENGKIFEFDKAHKEKVLAPNESKIIKKEIKHDLTEATNITFELIEE